MYFKNTLSIIIIFFSFSSFANTLKDSVGIENIAGKKVISHKVEPKESYYSLGRKYQVNPKEIMDYNKNISLQPGTIIKIPTSQNFVQEKNVVVSSSSEIQEKKVKESTHKVQPKETLYAIASKYNMRVDDLKLLNNLKSSSLVIGQVLKVILSDDVSITPEVVKNASGKPVIISNIPKPIKKQDSSIIVKKTDSTDSSTVIDIPKNKYGITEMNERGTAVWINDENLDPAKSYVLHRTAPTGTVIKITNPMTERSVFAKVVGKFTENETTKDVIIVVTKAAADAMGALDKRFFVNLIYGIPNEQ